MNQQVNHVPVQETQIVNRQSRGHDVHTYDDLSTE